MEKRMRGILLVVLGASLWGVMGIFVRELSKIGYSSFDTSFIRCISAGTVYFLIKAVKNPQILKIDPKGLVISCLYGLIAYGFSFISYGIAVERIPIAVATVLMFMSPIWVALLGLILFKEKLKKDKVVTIAVCILGAAMVSNLIGVSSGSLDMLGVLAGALNGFGVALQILVPRYFSNRYERDTMLVYGFLGGAVGLSFITDFSVIGASFTQGNVPLNLMNIFGIGVLCTMVANVSIVKSTMYIDSTTASILSALEVVIGAIVGIIVFREHMMAIQVIGACIVVLGALGPTLLDIVREKKAATA
ncbi:DMT family transporter [Anaerotignum sp. MB30-C6]|uniref:DMT family transporter n=1 Tax=Anaerotignum sp. MB30-C6 TaxID=3070814 RepID=UPI0027DE1F1D|nr:DMT family transporter [Anaerotignum sp. MB30-C6]WMI80297.1 DMT family transporter [Anaerotignum sp. MB30-C6]